MSGERRGGVAKAQVRRDSGVTHSGRPSLRIEALHAATFARAVRRPPAREGRSYALSGWMKTDLFDRVRGRIRAEWLDPRGRALGEIATGWAIGKYHWLRYDAFGEAPAGTVAARVVCEVMSDSHRPSRADHESGAIWFDDVRLDRTSCARVATPARCNLFFEGQTAEIEVQAEAGTFAYRVLDFAQRAVRRGRVRLARDVQRTVRLRGLPLGYYDFEWRLEAKGRAARRGALSFAVIVPPERRVYRPDSPIALDAGLTEFCRTRADLEQALYVVRAAGLACLRDRSSWSEMEPEPGRFKWRKIERAAQVQREAGVEVYQVFHDMARWLSTGPPTSRRRDAFPPRDLGPVRRFLAQACRRLKGNVAYWEIWNEPDISFFVGRPEDYAAMLKAAYLGCKEGDPEMPVLLGSVSERVAWFDRVFENGACPYFDIFNMHYYGPVDGLVKRIAENKAMMARRKCRKPIWVTEMGAAANRGRDGTFTGPEREQAAYLVKAYAHALGHGVDRFFFFFLFEMLEHGRSLWGIARADLTPKPAYVALCNLTHTLGEARAVGRLPIGDERFAYVFRDGERFTAIAWSDKPARVRIPVGARTVELIDMVGVRRRVRSPGGVLTIRLDATPVYIAGLTAAAARRAERTARWPRGARLEPASAKRVFLSLVFDPGRPRPPFDVARYERDAYLFTAGRGIPVAIGVHNTSDRAAVVRFEVAIPGGWRASGSAAGTVKVAANGTRQRRLTLHPPKEAGGEVMVRVTGASRGFEIQPAAGWLRPREAGR